MMRSAFVVIGAAAAVLWLAPLATAQDQDIETFERGRALAVGEDIEIMRSILDSAMEVVYDPQPTYAILTVTGEASVTTDGKNRVSDALGTYIEGHGVVYQLKAPGLSRPESSETGKFDACPFLQHPKWERTRLQLRRADRAADCMKCHEVKHARTFHLWPDAESTQAMYDARPQDAPTRDAVVEKVLDVLAENGHNFRALGPEERITVAITFGKQVSAAASHLFQSLGDPFRAKGDQRVGRPDTVGSGNELFFEGLRLSAVRESETVPDGGVSVPKQRALNLAGELAFLGDGRTAEGDLHLRQGNHAKAVEAYTKAIRESSGRDPYKDRPRESDVSLYKKLLQAQAGSGDLGKMQQLLELLTAVENLEPAEQRRVPVPARLVISVTKAQCDAVAADEISRKEFREQADVDYFDPAEKADALKPERESDED